MKYPKNIKPNKYKDGCFKFTAESLIDKFLGVEVICQEDTIMLRQLHLIEYIILAVKVYYKSIPLTRILHKDKNG